MRQIVIGIVLLAAAGIGTWLWLAEPTEDPMDANPTGPPVGERNNPDDLAVPEPSRTEQEQPEVMAEDPKDGREEDRAPRPEPDQASPDADEGETVAIPIDVRDAISNAPIVEGLRYSLFAPGHPARADRITEDPPTIPVPAAWLPDQGSSAAANGPRVVLEAAGYEPSARIPWNPLTHRKRPLVIRLMPRAKGAGVRLRLNTAAGPVTALLVELRRSLPTGTTESVWLRHTSSASGAYELPDIAPLTTPGARYRLIAQPVFEDRKPRPIAALRESFAFTGSERIELIRTLEPGSLLTLTLRSATTGQPVGNTPCTLFSGAEPVEMLWQEVGSGKPGQDLAVQDGGPPTAGPALGMYALRPGQYRLRIAPGGRSAQAIEQSITCRHGGQQVEVRIPQ